MQMEQKQVKFDMNKNEEHITWSSEDYDRTPIDSVLYRKCLGRVSPEEWENVFKDLDAYKATEMNVSVHVNLPVQLRVEKVEKLEKPIVLPKLNVMETIHE